MFDKKDRELFTNTFDKNAREHACKHVREKDLELDFE